MIDRQALRARIEATGLSQRKFAAKADVNYDALNKLLNARVDPRLSTLDKIETALRELEREADAATLRRADVLRGANELSRPT